MICAYCSEDKKATREHIIPKGFIDHMRATNVLSYADRSPIRSVNSEMTVKDVCADCNNGELSKLDAYALELLMDINNDIQENTKKIYFKYNKDKLIRWLLKICYNSARADKAHKAIELYKKNLGYILQNKHPQNNIAVYATFMGYDKCDGVSSKLEHLKKERTYEFDWFRITKSNILGLQQFNTTSRTILINSMAFMVVVSDDESEFEVFCTKIESSGYKFELLSNGKNCLKKDQDFIIQSCEGPALLLDNYGKRRNVQESFRILPIKREQIEEQDYTPVEWLINECMSNRDVLRDCMRSVLVSAEGYDNEIREVYQIKEYQQYFYNAFLSYPQIICLLYLDTFENNPNSAMIWAAVNKNYIIDLNNDKRDIEIDKEKLIRIMEKFYNAINTVSNIYVMDNSFIDTVTDYLNKFLGYFLHIDEFK